MENNRLEEIAAYIRERKHASMEHLTETFHISMSTLRRDVKKLIQTGTVRKTYGGIESTNQRILTPLTTRKDINNAGKVKIGRDAALSLANGDIIFMDSGSTVGAMAPFLGRLDNLTVITNNILIIEKVIHMPKIQLLTLSGAYNEHTFSFVGDSVAPMLRQYNINKAFMGTTGFSLTSGITHSTQLEAGVKHAAVAMAHEVILLADHLKFDTFAPFTYCTMNDIDVLYTDKAPSDEYRQLCAKSSTKICIAQ